MSIYLQLSVPIEQKICQPFFLLQTWQCLFCKLDTLRQTLGTSSGDEFRLMQWARMRGAIHEGDLRGIPFQVRSQQNKLQGSTFSNLTLSFEHRQFLIKTFKIHKHLMCLSSRPQKKLFVWKPHTDKNTFASSNSRNGHLQKRPLGTRNTRKLMKSVNWLLHFIPAWSSTCCCG